jgi:hypothetical protein
MLKDRKEARETALVEWFFTSVLLAFVSIYFLHRYRVELSLAWVWNWISIPLLLGLTFVYYRFAKYALAIAGLSPETVKVTPPASCPLSVIIEQTAKVEIERKEYY